MAENTSHRKLTAILSADIKGYSRLMNDDEAHTIETLTRYRNLFTQIITSHKGSIVNTPGDNILAEFSSALHAVESAVEIQQRLKIENDALLPARRMEYRIGINLGDILHREEGIYGDGVNIAARIEGMADPGSIFVSRPIFDQVRQKVTHGFEYLGEHQLKNIKEPVRVYRILLSPEHKNRVIGETHRALISYKKVITGLIVSLLACSVVIWTLVERRPELEPASPERMAYPLPEMPSIAVLPFENMSDDPNQEYFCDGMTEHIITWLSKVPYVFVIARNSTFSYKGRFVKVQAIAEELGVQYILEGSIQRIQDRVRVTAQLIDATRGYHVWAENYDRNIDDVFRLQDEIAMQIMAKMQIELTVDELGRLSAIETTSIKAYEKYLKGYEIYQKRTEKDTMLARNLAREAITLDPGYGAPYILLARTYLDDIWYYKGDQATSLDTAQRYIDKSIELSGKTAMTHQILCSMYYLRREYDIAISECARALELTPNSAQAHFFYGHALRWGGNFGKAIEQFEKAIRLNPVTPLKYLNNLAWALAYSGNYSRAISVWNSAIGRNPDYFFAHLGLTFAYQLTGEHQKAKAAAAEVLRLKPKLTISKLRKGPATRGIDREKIHMAMHAAGIPL